MELDGHSLSLDAVRKLCTAGETLTLAPQARSRVEDASNFVQTMVDSGQSAYGITTGFGRLANINIAPEDLAKLQKRLIVSHAAGVGDPLPADEALLTLAVRANTLASGHSGIRVATLDLMLELFNRRMTPLIPSQGSVCASGDLAPLAHLALILIGSGRVLRGSERIPGGDALREAGLDPVELAPKEGLALINGTTVATSILALTLTRAQDLIRLADIVAAMSLEALKGTNRPFDPRVHALRPHPGQVDTARNMEVLLAGSAILPSHRQSDHKVQDPYSLRCVPQVHGASRDGLRFSREICERELNAVTDNPLLFPDDGETISAGNFHGQHVALAADVAAMAIAELASISERRIEQMVNPDLSSLPAFLSKEPGLNSGFMMAQTTAAALVSENKTLAHPASVDSIPTSANQEDHVSMGMWAARKCRDILHNTRRVLAIEFLAAAQALDFEELAPGHAVAAARDVVRNHIEHLEKDRYLGRDLYEADLLLQGGEILDAVRTAVGELAAF